MLPERDLDLHAGVGVVAEHLGDAADRLRHLARLLDDVDHHHLPGLRLDPALALGRHEDVLGDALVLGDDEDDAVLDKDAADDAGVGALGDLDDAALRPPAAVEAGGPHQHAVAMQHLAHLVLVEKDVGAAVIGDQEAVAVGVALDPAGRQAGALGQDVGALAVAQQLAFALHGAEPALEHLALDLGDVEQFAQFDQGDRTPFFDQDLRDVFARRQGSFVTGELALEERISATDPGQLSS